METIDRLISKLDSYSFHDMPVENIAFKTEYGTELTLDLFDYNEITKDYDRLKLNFRDIQKLEFSNILLAKESELEVFSFHYEYLNSFKCKFLLLTGFGLPDFTIELSCENIEIISEP